MKNNVIIELSVVPVGTGDTSLSSFVADCLVLLEKNRNMKYQLTPMGTIVEGRLDEVIAAVIAIHEAPFKRGVGRVVTTIKIDDRRDKKTSMNKKIASVKKKAGSISR